MERFAYRLGPGFNPSTGRVQRRKALPRLVEQVPGGDQPVADAELDRDRRGVAHLPALAPDVLEFGVDENPVLGVLDLDRRIAANEVIEYLARPLDRRAPAAVHLPLGADLDFRVDELAHRRPVARGQGGQEAANDLICVHIVRPVAPAEHARITAGYLPRRLATSRRG